MVTSASAKVTSVPNPVYKETEPSAARIAVAIAASPYSPLTAVMDIVDNSVENRATSVSVLFDTDNKQIVRIVFADDGTGISSDQLADEVLRAGSRTRHLYAATSLSRYGIGLKGAGFALARKITFITRGEDGTVRRRSIDRDEIESGDRWVQDVRDPSPEEVAFFDSKVSSLSGGDSAPSGMVVILERVTLKTKDLTKLRSDLVRHAGETYGKFLGAAHTGDIQRLRVAVDGVAVEPFDPLHRENPQTVLLIKRQEILFADGASAFLTAVALPHPNTQTPEIQRRYRYTQKAQGVYVYRNGRLIRSGETFDLFSRDFHINNFRAELEFSTPADHHFVVDVAKSTLVPSEEAVTLLRPHINGATRTANTLWREKDVLSAKDIDDVFKETNNLIGSRAKLLVEAVNRRHGQLKTKKLQTAPPSSIPEAPTTTAATTTTPSAELETTPTNTPAPRKAFEGYLRPMDHLPGDVLYRPRLDGDLDGVVVEVNLAHPFSKAVFDFSPTDTGRSVPRRATTAIQQFIYVLGYCEFTMGDDEETERLFDQLRRYTSMNLSALLD